MHERVHNYPPRQRGEMAAHFSFDSALVRLGDTESKNHPNKTAHILPVIKVTVTVRKPAVICPKVHGVEHQHHLPISVWRPSSRCLVYRSGAAPCIFAGALRPPAFERNASAWSLPSTPAHTTAGQTAEVKLERVKSAGRLEAGKLPPESTGPRVGRLNCGHRCAVPVETSGLG